MEIAIKKGLNFALNSGQVCIPAILTSCNGSIRREFLNAYIFRTIDEVREKAE